MYKLFDADQIRAWDAATIEREPIRSIHLMERAAAACANWIIPRFKQRHFTVVCGAGNNGGDGLVIARLLHEAGQEVTCLIASKTPEKGAPDFVVNYERIKALPVQLLLSSEWPDNHQADIVIDALFGSGLDRPITGALATLVSSINRNARTIISIDLPSGYPAGEADFTQQPFEAIDADHLLTFMVPKRSFFFPTAARQQQRMRRLHVLDIGLDRDFYESTASDLHAFQFTDARLALLPRQRFSHKGTHGAVMIIAGQSGMAGAANLATGAALRSGVGLVFCHTPNSCSLPIQTNFPEAIIQHDGNEQRITAVSPPEKVTACAFGPGVGTHRDTATALEKLLQTFQAPLVLDADALNLLAVMPNAEALIAAHGKCVLTPHPAEFDRLFGPHDSLQSRIETARKRAQTMHAVIHLKGAYSVTVAPDSTTAFNTTGSAAMAAGGSGDVLTGLISGLLAQGYTSFEGCTLAAWMHGRAGELFESNYARRGMVASDLINLLPEVYRELEKSEQPLDRP